MDGTLNLDCLHLEGQIGGWVQKISSYADVQYCIYADLTPYLVLNSKNENGECSVHILRGPCFSTFDYFLADMDNN